MKKVLGIGSCTIGDADGPTSVFIAGKLNSDLAIVFILTGIILLVIAVIAYLKRKH